MFPVGETLTQLIGILIQVLEGVGAAVIVAGFVFATVLWPRELRRLGGHGAYLSYRRHSVRGLILGLEFLVAADIIRTVTIDYTLDSLFMLGLMVLIRAFLVFALHLEVEGRLPWQETDARSVPDRTKREGE
ncbi:DUF1622 domain-containing protein [Luteimonas suaedae]|uniref:DUF1622 domain-containing protein n=1 Tax=Luteimonas suaedae TaxID=2605430 RepID=UPI0011EFFC73|nr:DUF1622 domain-containing protein [Luteimonas suaedae]